MVGVLLGECSKGKADVTNSFAVPFEEDPKDPSIWYIDRQYVEDMFGMFKKVNGQKRKRGKGKEQRDQRAGRRGLSWRRHWLTVLSV